MAKLASAKEKLGGSSSGGGSSTGILTEKTFVKFTGKISDYFDSLKINNKKMMEADRRKSLALERSARRTGAPEKIGEDPGEKEEQKGFMDFLKNGLGKMLMKAVSIIKTVIAAVSAFIPVALAVVSTAIKGLIGLMRLGPIGLAITGIGGIAYFWKDIQAALSGKSKGSSQPPKPTEQKEGEGTAGDSAAETATAGGEEASAPAAAATPAPAAAATPAPAAAATPAPAAAATPAAAPPPATPAPPAAPAQAAPASPPPAPAAASAPPPAPAPKPEPPPPPPPPEPAPPPLPPAPVAAVKPKAGAPTKEPKKDPLDEKYRDPNNPDRPHEYVNRDGELYQAKPKNIPIYSSSEYLKAKEEYEVAINRFKNSIMKAPHRMGELSAIKAKKMEALLALVPKQQDYDNPPAPAGTPTKETQPPKTESVEKKSAEVENKLKLKDSGVMYSPANKRKAVMDTVLKNAKKDENIKVVIVPVTKQKVVSDY
jgi:hypothetical protein